MHQVLLAIALGASLFLSGCGGSTEQVSRSELVSRWNIDPLQNLRYRSQDAQYYYIDQQTAKGIRELRVSKSELTLPTTVVPDQVLLLDELRP